MQDIQRSGASEGRSRVSDTVGAITAHIRANALGPGDRLPSEAFFSDNLGVSRTVVREALRSLAAMRLIDLSAGKRATVARLDHGSMSALIEHGVHTDQISVHQIYDVRRTIETRTAVLAALHRTEAQGARIVELARAMRPAFETPEQVMEHDLGFHIEIAKAAKNPVFAMIVGAFEGVTRQTWPIGWRSRTTAQEQLAMIDLHIALGEAIMVGDPAAAAELMGEHFDVSVRALVAAGIA
ncbi:MULTISPECIES: FadR/GntR family transcriptional regulator [unclassified Roseitalea]|uniref:FadR/GntR family transcriptional regulator n=1 Tax=unclassified Roseitalea TaxID=2639107 RepID=UPI00273E55A8|nr:MULTISPECIES: FadR/GntR family transcriptional regulator [unclassified Roseitalea]